MEIALPKFIISKDFIDRILFSISSRNGESKTSRCLVHIFASPYLDNPNDIRWQYVSSGVACLLRNREYIENGRCYMWTINFSLCNASYGVIVWKTKILINSNYTAVTEYFHVFALGEMDVLVGLMFSDTEQACIFHGTYIMWNQERTSYDGKKGYVPALKETSACGYNVSAKLNKMTISEPCNFQHVQGIRAIDECLGIEKIKSDIAGFLSGLGTKVGRSDTDRGTSKAGKEVSRKTKSVKERLNFKDIKVPKFQSSALTEHSPTNIFPTKGIIPLDMDQEEFVFSTKSCADGNNGDVNQTTQLFNSPGQSFATDYNSYTGGAASMSGWYNVNSGRSNVAESVDTSSSQRSNLRVNQELIQPQEFCDGDKP